MKVLIFLPFHRDDEGGAEAVVERLAADLQNRGHLVHRVFRGGKKLQRIDEEHGPAWMMPFEHLRTRHKIPRLSSLVKMYQSTFRLHCLLSRIEPEIVNCHFANFSSLYFLLLRFLHDYRLIISTHGSDVMRSHDSLQKYVLPILFRGADHVTAVSSGLLDSASEVASIAGHSSTIHNGIDYQFWNRSPQGTSASADVPLKTERAGPVITHVGALRSVKGQDVLLDAFSNLSESFPSAQLDLVGKGDDRNTLLAQAKQLGVRDRVTFHGWCSRLEVRRILESSTVFAFPSRSEGFGFALIEAMAVGLPVVGSEVGGILDILSSEEGGILVPPESPDALASAIENLLGSPTLRRRMGKSAAERAKDFRWTDTVDKYENLFTRLRGPNLSITR